MSASSSRANRQTRTRRGVGQRVGVRHVPGERRVERRQRLLVEPDEQLRGRRRREDLVEEDLQGRVRAPPPGPAAARASRRRASRRACDVLGAEVGVVREAGLQLVDRLGGDAGGEDLVQPLEGVVIPLQPRDARLDRQAGPGRLLDRGQARQGRQAAVRLIGLGHEVHPPGVESPVVLADRRTSMIIPSSPGVNSSTLVGRAILVEPMPLDRPRRERRRGGGLRMRRLTVTEAC